MRTLPIDASDDEIKDLVVDWSELLADKRYADALSEFPHSTQEYDWTPELLERVIDGYGVVDPDPDVIQGLREDHGVARFEVTTLRGRPDRDQIVERSIDVDARAAGGDDELGWVHYFDVPLNGFLSHLTARFIVRRVGADRLTLEFYDLHVM